MRLRIGRIIVLIRVVGVGNFLGQLFGDRVVAARILGLHRGRTHDDLGAERLQEIDLLARLLVGDRKNQLVASLGGDERETDPRISGSPLDDRAARLELAAFFRVVDHRHRDPVLDRAPGIEILHLRVNLRREPLGKTIQPHQGRVADGFQDVFVSHNSSAETGSPVSENSRRLRSAHESVCSSI